MAESFWDKHRVVLNYLVVILATYDFIGDMLFTWYPTYCANKGFESATINILGSFGHVFGHIGHYLVNFTFPATVAKESLKMMAVISMFFAPTFRQPRWSKYAANSPFLLFIYPFNKKIRELMVKQSKEHNKAFPLFWDTLLEDAPQMFLVFLRLVLCGGAGPVDVVCLSGSLLVISINTIRMIRLCRTIVRKESTMLDMELGDSAKEGATVQSDGSPPAPTPKTLCEDPEDPSSESTHSLESTIDARIWKIVSPLEDEIETLRERVERLEKGREREQPDV